MLSNELIGLILKEDVSKHDFVFWSHFEEKPQLKLFRDGKMKWGIPVRPHDFLKLHKQFDASTYEFHISYSDLARKIPEEDWSPLKNKNIVVHAPELFENSELLDLCADSLDKRRRSIANLQRVIDFTLEISRKVKYQKRIGIVGNVGGFSVHAFKGEDERQQLYDRVFESMQSLEWGNTEILVQNMAPFPWHFGGQRYQNIFCHPDEITAFCRQNGTKICLDTAHLSMHCAFHNIDFNSEFEKLLPYTAHLHMSDASGLNGEGVELGKGDIDFNFVMNGINKNQTFIVETWQGHKAHGTGFARDLQILDRIR